jgi:hypothetical protein
MLCSSQGGHETTTEHGVCGVVEVGVHRSWAGPAPSAFSPQVQHGDGWAGHGRAAGRDALGAAGAIEDTPWLADLAFERIERGLDRAGLFLPAEFAECHLLIDESGPVNMHVEGDASVRV